MSNNKITLDVFRQLVDRAPIGIDVCREQRTGGLELTALYGYVDLPVGPGLTMNAVRSALDNKIRAAFTSGGRAAAMRCHRLIVALVYAHYLDDRPLDSYFGVATILRDALKSSDQPGAEICGDWTAAINSAVDEFKTAPQLFNSKPSAGGYRREREVARAARTLRARGFGIALDEDEISLKDGEEERLAGEIENLIRMMGGINLARRIFTRITPSYSDWQERYHVFRQSTIAKPEEERQSIPFGLLINFAAKHPTTCYRHQNKDRNFDKIIELSTCYASVYNVQDFGPFFVYNIDPQRLLEEIRRIAVCDDLYYSNQLRGRDVVRILRGLLHDADLSADCGAGCSIDDALVISSAILQLSQQVRGPVHLSATSLADHCDGLTPATINKALEHILSHPVPGANQGFMRPNELNIDDDSGAAKSTIDFFNKPLLKTGEGRYCLLDRAVCAPSFIESVFAQLRNSTAKFDETIGRKVEEFLRNELINSGVASLFGNYSVGKKTLEADLIVQNDKSILFIEIKKKVLTRISRAGSPGHILIDLSKSLLEAVYQAQEHEINLRRVGFIELEKDGQKVRLDHKGRNVECIAVSLLDFGGFQDRVFVNAFLNATVQLGEFSTDTDNQKFISDLKKCNKKISEIQAQLPILDALRGCDRQPFFGCWFLSIPQILILLDGVRCADDFIKNLWKTRHISYSSRDFYKEYAQATELLGKQSDGLC